MTRDDDDKYLTHVIEHYGLLLSVKDITELFKYPNAEAVRKACKSGTLPVQLKAFPKRRGLFVTAFDAAVVLRKFDGAEEPEK